MSSHPFSSGFRSKIIIRNRGGRILLPQISGPMSELKRGSRLSLHQRIIYCPTIILIVDMQYLKHSAKSQHKARAQDSDAGT